MEKQIKIKQIYAVEFKGKQIMTAVTEDGQLLRYIEDLKNGDSHWSVISVPKIKK